LGLSSVTPIMSDSSELLRHIASELADDRNSKFEKCRVRFDDLIDLCMIDVIMEEARHERDIDRLIDLGAEMREIEATLEF